MESGVAPQIISFIVRISLIKTIVAEHCVLHGLLPKEKPKKAFSLRRRCHASSVTDEVGRHSAAQTLNEYREALQELLFLNLYVFSSYHSMGLGSIIITQLFSKKLSIMIWRH